MDNLTDHYFLSGDYGLIAPEDDSFWVYVPRLDPELDDAIFSISGSDALHFTIEPETGIITFEQTIPVNFGDSFQVEIVAKNENLSASKLLEIKVLPQGIERAIFTYEEKISGTPYTEAFKTVEEQVINSITWGGRWVTDVGDKTTLYYSFAEGADPFEIVYGPSNWTDAEKDEVRRAIQVYEDLINIDFVEVTFDDNILEFDDGYSLLDKSEIANFWLWKSQLNALEDGVLGYSDVPAYSYGQPLYLELNYETDDFVSQNIGIGTEAYETILHELGHMLGLAHPFDGGAAEDASVVSWRWDSTFFTIMSYDGSVSSEPSLNDIVALRNIYGDRASSDLGDSHYLVIENMSNSNRRVWDYAGSNTLDLSGAVLVSMQETNKPNRIYEIGNQLYVNFQDSIYNPSFQAEGNFDRLVATDAADSLIVGRQQLGSKFQEIDLGAGNDTVMLTNAGLLNIDLGDGVDSFTLGGIDAWINGAVDVKVDGAEGSDFFELNFDQLYILEGEHVNSIYDTLDLETIFNFSIEGGNGVDTLKLQSNLHGTHVDLSAEIGKISNIIFSIEGIERIYATDSVDEIIGGANQIEIFGGDGADFLSGGSADDSLYGGLGDDTLLGGLGDDLLVGDQGADTLIGGFGNDTLYIDNLDTFDAGEGFDWVVFESPAIVNNVEKTFSFDVKFDANTNDYVATGDLKDFSTFEVGVLEGSGGRLYGDDSSEVHDLSTGEYLEFFGNGGDDQHINRFNNYSGVEFYGGEGNDTLDLQFWIDGRVNFIEEVGEGEDAILVDKFNAHGLDIYLPSNVENFFSTEAKKSNYNYNHNIYGNTSDNKILAPAQSSVFGGAGADVLVLKYGPSYADGGEDDDIILISSAAYGSVANGGSGDDLIFIEASSDSIEILDSGGNDVYIFGENQWSTSLTLPKYFSEYSFIKYQDRYFVCDDDELNLIHSTEELLLVDPVSSKIKSDFIWQTPDVTQLGKIVEAGFLNIRLGNPIDLVVNRSQASLNDLLGNNYLLNLNRNYFTEGYTSDPKLIGLNDWFYGFNDDGELVGSLDLFESVYSNKKSDILLISSDIEDFGVFFVPFSITAYAENWNDFIRPTVETLTPIEVGEQFNFLLADVFVGDLTSSGYLHADFHAPDDLYYGNKAGLNFDISGLPSGTQYDFDTGYISGAIENAGLFNILLTVSGEDIYAKQVVSLFAYDENETFSNRDLKYDVVRLGEDLFAGNTWVGYHHKFDLERLLDFDVAHLGLASAPTDIQNRFSADYTSVGKIFEDIEYHEEGLSEGVYSFFGLTNEGLTGNKFSSSADLIFPSLDDAVFEGQLLSAENSSIERNSSFELRLPEIDGMIPHYARFIDASKIKDDNFSSVKGVLDETTGVVSFGEWYPYADVSDDIIIYALYGDQSLIGSAKIDFVSTPFLKVKELSIRQGHAVQHEVKLGNIDGGETYKLSLQNSIPEGISFDPETNILTLDIESHREDTYYDEVNFTIEQLSVEGTESFSETIRLKITDNNAPILSTTTSITMDEDTSSEPILFSGSDPDQIDTLTYKFSDPEKGSITNNNNGTYSYTPKSDANGSDSFIITVNDGAEEVSQTVNVTINAVNDAPTISSDLDLILIENDTTAVASYSATDIDGDELTISFTSPSKGVAIDNGDSTYSYVPATDAYGKDSFDIEVSDGSLMSSQTVEVVIIEKLFEVKVAPSASGVGNRYYIDGVEAQELTLKQGHIYQFDLSDPSTSNHPLSFSAATSQFELDIMTSGTRGVDQIITVSVPENASGTIDYFCILHSDMGNSVNIAEPLEITVSVTGRDGLAVHDFDVLAVDQDEQGSISDFGYIEQTDATGFAEFIFYSTSEVLVSAFENYPNDSQNNQVNELDALRLMEMLLPGSSETMSQADMIASDFNRDGKVDTMDIKAILEYSVGLAGSKQAEWALVDTASLFGNTPDDVAYDLDISIMGLTSDISIDATAILIGDVNNSFV